MKKNSVYILHPMDHLDDMQEALSHVSDDDYETKYATYTRWLIQFKHTGDLIQFLIAYKGKTTNSEQQKEFSRHDAEELEHLSNFTNSLFKE